MTITTILAAAALALWSGDQERPEWATDVVPDTVVVLVEHAAATEDGGLRKDLLREAEVHARATVAEHDDVDSRYALAVVLGMRANVEGGKTKVRLAEALSEELDFILARDPWHPGARHLLGRLYAGIRRMSGLTRWFASHMMGGEGLDAATWEEAEANLVFAERHAPDVPDHHLQLALLYRDTGRPEMASEELRHVFAFEPRDALERAVLNEALEVRSQLGQ